MNDAAILPRVFDRVRSKYALSVHRKRSSPFMWFLYVISFIWLWNRSFMDGYWTTIAGRCYAPRDELAPSDWRTLAHEGRHAKQSQDIGEPLFSLAYLFPAPLALLSLLAFGAFWSPWFLLALGFLAALAPWPARWRNKYETQAYTMTEVADSMRGVNIGGPSYVVYMAAHFGQAYYWPAWRSSTRTTIARQIIADAKAALAGDSKADLYLLEMIALVRASDRALS